MQLNGPQVGALYSLCAELGFGSHIKFEVMSQEEVSKDIIIDVTGDYLSGPGRYKLFARGGRQFLSGAVKPNLSEPDTPAALE